eukprot:scaffold1454_cov342-Pavlova_lutheri.AAC.17
MMCTFSPLPHHPPKDRPPTSRGVIHLPKHPPRGMRLTSNLTPWAASGGSRCEGRVRRKRGFGPWRRGASWTVPGVGEGCAIRTRGGAAELTGVHRSVCLSGKVLAFSIAKKVAALAIGYVRVQESEDGCPSRRSFVVRSTDGVVRSFCPFPCTARQRSRRIDIWVPQVVSKVQRTVPVLDEQQRDAREGERFCEISTALPNKVQRHVEEYGWQEQLWHYPREDHHELTA